MVQAAPSAVGALVGAASLLPAAAVGSSPLGCVGCGVRAAGTAVELELASEPARVSSTAPPTHAATSTRPISPSAISSVRPIPPRLAGAPGGLAGVLGSEPTYAPGTGVADGGGAEGAAGGNWKSGTLWVSPWLAGTVGGA